MLPAKRAWPGAGLQLGKVCDSFGDEFAWAASTAETRTLAAMQGKSAVMNDMRREVEWANVHLPAAVVALLDGLEVWSRKPVLRFALQMLSPSVNERARAQLRDGVPLAGEVA